MNKTIRTLINVAIGLVIAGFAGYVMYTVNKDETTYVEKTEAEEAFESRYRKASSFDLPQDINRFEWQGDALYIVAGETTYIYGIDGDPIASFPVKPGVRDIAVAADRIYILYPTLIEVYSEDGALVHAWEACSDLSDYCSLALAGDFVWVTDAGNKNICQYTHEGNFVRFISSPNGFIIPSYAFDIASYNDILYCANSGRHSVESYTLTGEFIAAFGTPGVEAGSFAGCCNPAYISFTPEGKLLTSEKGNPRISSFEPDGTFHEVLLNNTLLGGGNKAYEIKTDGTRLFVAGKNTISIFETA